VNIRLYGLSTLVLLSLLFSACSTVPADGEAMVTSSISSGTSGSTEPPGPPKGPKFHQSAPPDLTDGEVGAYLESKALPLAPTHGGAFETMVNAVSSGSTPDVIIFGDSMVQQGVDPAVLSDLLSVQRGEPVTVFNGASSRARWGINRLLARYLVNQAKVPKLALVGITTRAGEDDVFYATEASTTAFSAVVEGCERLLSDTWDESNQMACERTQTDLVFRFRDGGGQISWARDGHPLQTSLQLDADSTLRDDGMILHPGVDADEAERISDKRMERGFPGFPRNDEDSTEQFKDMVRILERAGVTVLAFEVPYTPVHQDNLEQVGRNYNARRHQVAVNLATAADVPLYPVERFGPWWGDGDSRDAIHLSPQGAKDFTKQLSELPGLREAVGERLAEESP